MMPGINARPSASITCLASLGSDGAMARMRPPRTARSARIGSAPLPSYRVAWRIRRSSMGGSRFGATRGGPAYSESSLFNIGCSLRLPDASIAVVQAYHPRRDRVARLGLLALALQAGMLLALPPALAQPSDRVFRIGVLALGTPRASPAAELFVHALREHGYVEGR